MRSLNRGRASLPSSNSNHDVRAFGAGLFVLALAGGLISAQGRPAQPPAESALRSELSLDAHTASVSILPALRADDAGSRSLFASGAGAGNRVRIGRLQTNGALKIGGLAFAKNDLRGSRYELWLQGTRGGWQLGIIELPMPPMPPMPPAAGAPAGAPPAPPATGSAAATPPTPASPAAAPNDATAGEPKPVGEVALTPHPVSTSSPTLLAALVPSSATGGRLVLRWGGLEASTDVQFTEPQRLPAGGGGQPNQPVNRKHDEDTTVIS